MPTAMAAPHSPKASMRMRMRALRRSLDPALGEQLAAQALALLPFAADDVVAGYWPLTGEIDLRPLLYRLQDRSICTALPEVGGEDQELVFRRLNENMAVKSGRFGTSTATGALVQPSILLVPLLAFDRRGSRLGYGRGYYDRTLATLPSCRAIGCAFAAQEVATVPTEAHDVRLDAIATEAGVIFAE